MKKLLTVTIILTALISLILTGCAGAPEPMMEKEPAGEIKVEPRVYPPKVIEHKKSALGGDVPDWVFEEAYELEEMDSFKDSYVFIFDQGGKNLDGLKSWTRSFVAASEVARMVSTRVMNKFAGAQVGDKDMVETYMEEVVKVLSVAEYSGSRKKDDFWVYQQYYKDDGKPDKKEYRYWLLYTVPRDQVEDAIDRALERSSGATKPKTEEETVARDRVKELFKEGL